MKNYVFFLSNWYSGATLLAILLNNHKDLTCNGETFPFSGKKYICSCGNILSECPFYTKAASHMLNQGEMNKDVFRVLPRFSKNIILQKWLSSSNYFSKVRDFYIYNNKKMYEIQNRFVNDHLLFYEKSCEIENSSYYIDGTKSLRRLEHLINIDKVRKPKMFFLIRDGRGFCWSYLKNNKLPKKFIRNAAISWLEYIELIDSFLKRYPNIECDFFRYEDLCNNTSNTLKNICNFIGVKYDNNVLANNYKQYHILGNTMRKNFNWNIDEDLSWKDNLTIKEIKTITSIMRDKLHLYGYI